ncbi:Asp-tRNA(Asn)/Glu-tRNA(Gln) amidotransferase subunit GatA [Aureimonas fodinaquatilis]|uniref:Asp-tRNA(Asn)/Glu-tRNA(Gln) amidotransferase subunit GatA n=1 Tax=Aureimonas fodinaquatilis TaxID=2565783 RepID=A0A5B0E1Q9_9HYPH|nr:amidase [Aureimonas fodinaquatilis]KAA0971901.1 Asp-tRNA(Asn)/Glu-tRNA(Gln) amidotransferase subunit GatA [Aureimonas fodinaquatilis]
MRAALSIREAQTRLRQGSLKARDLMEAAIVAADRHACELNVFAARADSDGLLTAADKIDRRLATGEAVGPLAGIPIAIKDVFGTKDLPTTASSKVLADHHTGVDAEAVARLRSSGALVVGKSQTHEFAFGPTTNNEYAGPSRNPWNPDHVPGGSSGGSAIALAAGMCMGATGSDTGGSIRTPSALCGVSGLKPTYGLVSRRGVLSLAWSLDHAGPMARSVDDLAFLLEAMAGFDARDSGSVDRPVQQYSALMNQPAGPLRIGVPQDYFLDLVDVEVHAAFDASLECLQSIGCKVHPVSLPSMKYALGAELAILGSEASAYHRDRLKRQAEDYSPNVRRELLAGLTILASDYLLGQRVRGLICKDFATAFQNVDVIATPTVPIVAPLIGATQVVVNGEATPALDAIWRNVFPTNLTGSPTLSLPNGFSKSGLPIGLQLIGRYFDETTLLRLGRDLQAVTEFHRQAPPMIDSA